MFGKAKSCNEHILMFLNIPEQYQTPPIVNYVDLKKLLGSIYRPALGQILHINGVPET